jgi:GNAT superfamily N-acetyltransferase
LLPITDKFNLPRKLGNGLVLRWGRPGDVDALADFNGMVHSQTAEPDIYVANWTRDLMKGDHPTTKASDFLVVVDENNDGKIVSSLTLISQTWSFGGIPFRVGRPEAVGTDPEYRRRGLVRAQFDVIHALSASRGEMVQVITGIPYYYRQFGYGMALDLSGGRRIEWHAIQKLDAGAQESFRLRPATTADIPVLAELYSIHCSSSLVSRLRDQTEWHFELGRTEEKSLSYHQFYIVETLDGVVAGYTEFIPGQPGGGLVIRELAVRSGFSLRSVSQFLIRALKSIADDINRSRKDPLVGLNFSLGEVHPVYIALGSLFGKPIQPYAFYVRVPDLAGFLMHIRSVIEKRLIGSPMENHTGALRLNFYTSQLSLNFEYGRLKEVVPFQPKTYQEGDAVFPGLTFLDLLFGRRSMEELRYIFPDCYPCNNGAGVLLDLIFPRKPSCVSTLN